MTESDLLTVTEALKYLRISRSTLARMKLEGTGPKHVQQGRRVFYRRADLDEYLNNNTVTGV